ncbi:hypothetical protein THTE_0953 [Thermogutta terrifontis]|uniref:Uncharacterized protein n=1 Tax=Thermogutta terrifontis TaxID=1331910 RepID=A0A286RC70_9BACT|nr:hypothetical protein [Thermogutta terrifontis]ASV73555.1 hypothetical protein THTE_0953 [Thermogutta terrifontis]
MVRKAVGGLLALGFLLVPLAVWAQSASESACQPACQPACAPEVTCVQKTVLTRQWVTEMRKVRCVEYVPQQREYTTYRVNWVKETQVIEKTFTEWKLEPRVKEIKCVGYRPVWKSEPYEYTVYVPKIVKEPGTRKVCKWVQVEEPRKICVDEGHWEERPCEPVRGICRHCHRRVIVDPPSDGACCPPKPVCVCKVWVPNPVVKEITVKVWKPQIVEEPCEITKCVWEPQKRQGIRKWCEWERYEYTKKVCYYECVPHTVTKPVCVTTWKKVCEPVVKKCTVLVPQVVEKEVPVKVCKLVPTVVNVPVRPCHVHHRLLARRAVACCDP